MLHQVLIVLYYVPRSVSINGFPRLGGHYMFDDVPFPVMHSIAVDMVVEGAAPGEPGLPGRTGPTGKNMC